MAKQEATVSSAHVLPRWFEWWQDHVVLSLLIVAGMILNGLMFAQGIVSNVESPDTWGVFHGIIFVAFFAAGSGLTGVALRASATMGTAFRAGDWGEAISNLIVSLIFIPIEVWASITERSLTRLFTPADQWILQLVGHPALPISPTVIAIAVASPLILFSWGIVTRKPTIETPAEQQARQQHKLAEAQYKAQLRQVQAANLAGIGRTFVTTAIGSKDQSLPGDTTQPSGDNLPPDDGGNVSLIGGKDGRLTTGKDRASGKAGSGRGNLSVMPRNLLTADDLRQSLAKDNHVFISEADALAFIKAQPSAERVMGIQGQPWAANKAATLQRARAKFAQGNMTVDEAL